MSIDLPTCCSCNRLCLVQDFPETPKQKEWQCKRMPDKIDWDDLMAEVLRRGTDVPALSFWKAGEDEAYAVSLAAL